MQDRWEEATQYWRGVAWAVGVSVALGSLVLIAAHIQNRVTRHLIAQRNRRQPRPTAEKQGGIMLFSVTMDD